MSILYRLEYELAITSPAFFDAAYNDEGSSVDDVSEHASVASP